jgi:hypothetical protein
VSCTPLPISLRCCASNLGGQDASCGHGASNALLLNSLESDTGLIAPLGSSDAEPAVEALLGEVAAWARAAMGRAVSPVIWRIVARNPHYLEATWRKDVAVIAAGALTAGDTNRDLLEILGVVGHYTTLNTLSEAMQIESDIRPPA